MIAARTGPRVLVAQLGARRRYAVPMALEHAGILHRLVTDACAATTPWNVLDSTIPPRWQPHPLRAVLGRRTDGVEPRRVWGRFRFFVDARLGSLRQRPGEPRSTFWVRQNRAFGEHVCALEWGDANHVYAFNGAALEVFSRARRLGLACILDQTAAPWRFNSRLLAKEMEKWPDWEHGPADLDTTGEMIEREEAEWALADRIVCGSPFVVDAIREVGGPAEKCVVVPYPVPPAQAVPRTAPFPAKPYRVLFVGTLQLRKGIQYVWDAARQLPPGCCEFRAVGGSHLTPRAHRALSSCVDWNGPASTTEVWHHYRWADALLLPTLSEGSANVCWEAQADGLAVITTPNAGYDGPNAVLVTCDGAAVAAAITNHATRLSGAPSGVAHRSIQDYGADLVKAIA